MTELAKVSKVSRTLIYYYFGKSKEDILLEAVSLFGKELAGETPARTEAWKLGQIGATLGSSQELLSRSPSIRAFYFLRRSETSKVGEAIRDFENKFRNKIHRFFPTLKKAERDGLYAVFFGLALTPDTTAESAQAIVNMLMTASTMKS